MVNGYHPNQVKRFIEVRERQDDCTSRLICMVDFALNLLVIYHRGERQVVMLDEEYARWLAKYVEADAGGGQAVDSAS